MPDISEQILTALRRVTRAVDRYSRQLAQNHGLTSPQALIMKVVLREPGISMGELARRVGLSQATVTDIAKRLVSRQLLSRHRDPADRRRVTLRLTDAGQRLLAAPLPLLQEDFLVELDKLQTWEQTQLLSSLQRIAEMMHAQDLDASPVLASGGVAATPEAVVLVTQPATAGRESEAPQRPDGAGTSPPG